MVNNFMYKKYVKRILDILFASVMIIVLIPVYLLTSILVAIFMGCPVVFKQARPGKDNKIFYLYKFRTMTNEKDENGNLLPDYQRLTDFGKFLRSTSIDELPELFNILKGEMSFVGPRPLLVKYLELYNDKQIHRHDVRPGLTGLAQVNGRNALTWKEKFNYDIEYVNNISFLFDMKIIFKTFSVVFQRKNISSSSSETMEEFTGNND